MQPINQRSLRKASLEEFLPLHRRKISYFLHYRVTATHCTWRIERGIRVFWYQDLKMHYLLWNVRCERLVERRSEFSLTEKQMKLWLFCCYLGANKPTCPAHDIHPARPVGVCCTPSSAGLWILYTGHSRANYPSSK